MNKVRKIFGGHQVFLPASQLASENLKSKIVIKTYITLEQKEMLWTRELQELLKKKKCYPEKILLILLKSLEQL